MSLRHYHSSGGHACYLSVQDDGKIRYMDPNYGAFLFHYTKDFIDFYVGLLGIPHMLQDHWHRFKEKRLSSASASSSKTNDSRAVTINECSINCSTSAI